MQWNFEPIWKGETCFIVAGGPSVRHQNLKLLRGRKVLVINSSIHTVPWADAHFFGDDRWWRIAANQTAVLQFPGIAVSVAKSVTSGKVTVLFQVKTGGLVKDRNSVMMKRTSLAGAVNLAVHFGVERIVLLGADGKKEITVDKRGKKFARCHHHEPHPWPVRPGCWDAQKKELLRLVEPLKKLGIEVLNASPGSAWADLWPIVTLESVCATQPLSPKMEPLTYCSPAVLSPAMETANLG